MEQIKVIWFNMEAVYLLYFIGAIFIIYIVYKIMAHGEKPAKNSKVHVRMPSTYECNKEILHILEEYIEENPRTHFGSAIMNLGIVETGMKNGKKYTINPQTVKSHQTLTRIKYVTQEQNLSENSH